jgi:septal ring factor EnvC (AmiA/AmiB activator)
MTKSTTMDGLAKQRLVHSEPIETPPELEKLYDGLGRALPRVMDEFDDKLAERDAKIVALQARLAEREDKQAAHLEKIQANLLKQIKRLNASLAEQARRHAREIKELQAKASPSSEIIGYGTSKTEYRIFSFKSNGRPGASINLRPLFERYYQETQQ